MTAVSIKAVDTALLLRYSGLSIDVDSVPTAVEVFIEEPSVEEYSERVYPSVALKLEAVIFDAERAHSSDDEYEEVGYNDAVSPPVRSMRLRPTPFNLAYTLDTWHRVRAGESRDLLRDAIIQATPPRGAMDVADVDGGTEKCWVRWAGSVASIDEVTTDYVVYHKTLTIEVQVDLLTDTSVTDVKVVTDALWRTYQRKTQLSSDGKSVISVDGSDVLFQQIRVTEDDVTGE